VICNHLRQAEKSAKHWSQKEAERPISFRYGWEKPEKNSGFSQKRKPDSIGGWSSKGFFQNANKNHGGK